MTSMQDPGAGRASGLPSWVTPVLVVVAVVLLAFTMMFFVRTGDPMILMFGMMTAGMFVVLPFVILVLVRVANAPAMAPPPPSALPRCGACEKQSPPGARYCMHCGAPL